MAQPDHYISRLRLTTYRNYSSAALDLGAQHVVLTGPNGAGKTNLIEAVSLLSPGRGLRRANFDALPSQSGDGNWAVAATVETPYGPTDLGTGSAPDTTTRRVRINGANAKTIDELADHIRLLWLTPAMDGLFTGGASDRRRFLDRLVMTLISDHGKNVTAYERAMRHRNKLLEDNADQKWLDAVEMQMAESAAALHFSRADSLAHLEQLATKDIVEGFPAATLGLTALFEDNRQFASSTQLETALIRSWADGRYRDRAAGRTLIGPHRIDLLVSHAQKAMPANLCSTGEQKALLIGLILAHAHLIAQMAGQTPILLLDEIAAHLDPDRRAALFASLDRLNTQCFMTGTDPLLFEALGARGQYFHVDAGSIATRA